MVTVEYYDGEDEAGAPFYKAPVQLVCRIEQKMIFDWGPQGQIFLPGTVIYFPVPQVFDAKSRLTLPDGSHPIIRNIKHMKQLDVVHHTTLVCR